MQYQPVFRSILAASCASMLACLHNEGPPTGGPLFATTTIDSTVGSVTTTSLVVDVSQHVHVLYSQDGISTLRYATCAGLCAQNTSWQRVTVDTTANSGLASSLVIDAGGLHATYQVFNGQGDLRYAACAGACLQATSWQVATIDSSGDTGHDGSLAADASGRLHVTYIETRSGGRGYLKYAFCGTACTTATNWQVAIIDSATYLFASARSLAVDGSGRRHLVYQKSDSLGVAPLYYARCDTGCTGATNWQSAPVDLAPLFDAAPVLALDGEGHPRSGYWDLLNNQDVITYATCDTQCTTPGAWHILPLQTIEQGSSDLSQHSLVIDQAGRPHMSFQHAGLSYAACNLNCTTPGSWFEVPIEATTGGTGIGSGSSVGVLPVGVFQAGIVYLSAGDPGGGLKFAQSN
ncbi:MAG TPA: hypothetical protein VL563_07155 [Gemmatimonadales bacterium]|jgi:hypothetical protein|nr:hypothetical protein [Gemmatimonadales bacterium]